MKAGSDQTFLFPSTNNIAFYVLEGDVKINDSVLADQYSLIAFENDESEIKLNATSNATLLLMAGEPINEPLVTHGPFVMTSQTEVMEAMRDYQEGKMGFLY
jgi:hypothetical protein